MHHSHELKLQRSFSWYKNLTFCDLHEQLSTLLIPLSPLGDWDKIWAAKLLIFENVTSSLVWYIKASLRQINTGRGSTFINLWNTPVFLTYLSFNLMMQMPCIDFNFALRTRCSFPFHVAFEAVHKANLYK